MGCCFGARGRRQPHCASASPIDSMFGSITCRALLKLTLLDLVASRVFSDEEWFRSIFSASTKREAIRNQVRFWTFFFSAAEAVYTHFLGNSCRVCCGRLTLDLKFPCCCRTTLNRRIFWWKGWVDQSSTRSARENTTA